MNNKKLTGKMQDLLAVLSSRVEDMRAYRDKVTEDPNYCVSYPLVTTYLKTLDVQIVTLDVARTRLAIDYEVASETDVTSVLDYYADSLRPIQRLIKRVDRCAEAFGEKLWFSD